jgi:ZIP family zinc transporter/zinc and cadmium transporter
MSSQLFNTIAYSIIAGLATLIGVYMIFAREKWARRNSVYFLSFSAGVVLSVCFTHILPEAIGHSNQALTITLFTLIAFYILEHTILIHTCYETEDCEVHSMGLPSFMGIGFHSLIDGVVIGVGFEAGFAIGFAATMGILLHRLPVGITVSSLLLHSGYSRKKTLVMGWIVALATAVGALGSYAFIRGVSDEVIGALLAFSAGSFIYIGASDLLPETHKNFKSANIILVLAGVFLVYIVSYLIGGH